MTFVFKEEVGAPL